jgi:tetratricopeptide (TPR) repeat protein
MEYKDYDRAIRDFDVAIKLKPRDAKAFGERGAAWWSKHDYGRALADFNEAVDREPMYAAAYRHRAWLWATCPDPSLREGKRAVESATKACELDHWKDIEDLATLAAAYAEWGDFDAAIKWQTQVTRLLRQDDAGYKDESARLKLYHQRKPYRESPNSGQDERGENARSGNNP